MESSRSELMTVREMIDAAIVFNNDDAIVDFKLLEAVFFIIARQLNVLARRVYVEGTKIKKYKIKIKNTVAVSEIKVHRRVSKKTKDTTTTTDTATEKSPAIKPQHKRKRSRQRSRSKKRGRYSSEDDSDSRRRGHKKHGRYRDDDDGQSRKRRRFRDDSQDVLHERILVVSRTSLEGIQERDHRAAVVTQKQYDKLLAEVRRLQENFGIVSNIDLHMPTSFTDPRAALHMATRLDVAHKKLNQMIDTVTKFAGVIPGFEIDAAVDDSLFQLKSADTPSSKQTPKTISTSRSPLTEPEEIVMDDFLWDDENLATWSQLNADMDEMRKNVVDRVSVAATNTVETANRASKLFKLNAPKLSQASILNVKFARLRIFFDRFTNNATALDVKMATQMGDCQERVSQMQFDVESLIERIEDALAHPAEDPGAVAAIQDDFGLFQGEIADAQRNQDALKQLHELRALELERIRRKLEMIRQIKTTREEALDYLKEKATANDVNSLLSNDQLYAVVCFLQQEISNTNDTIHSGELMWQRCLEDFLIYLHSKGDRIQVASLHQSLRKYISIVNTKVNNMLDIVGEFPVIMYKKKLDRDGNCLSCGTPANVKLSEKNKKLAKQLISRNRPIKPHVIENEETEKRCLPGRPIPHPLDPRALVCDRYCGASISKSEESLKSSMGIDVIDMNPTHKPDMQNRVYLTCTPCTQSEETFFK